MQGEFAFLGRERGRDLETLPRGLVSLVVRLPKGLNLGTRPVSFLSPSPSAAFLFQNHAVPTQGRGQEFSFPEWAMNLGYNYSYGLI